jgi:hypothetical protein
VVVDLGHHGNLGNLGYLGCIRHGYHGSMFARVTTVTFFTLAKMVDFVTILRTPSVTRLPMRTVSTHSCTGKSVSVFVTEICFVYQGRGRMLFTASSTANTT